VRHGRYDTIAGGILAAIFGCGALIAGAALLGHGGAAIQGLAGAGFPGALAQVSGKAVGTLFALGLIEAGAVAVLTISASTGYAVGECIGAPHSLNNSARGAAAFYTANVGAALIAAAIILIPGVPLLSIALNANVLATVLLPVVLVFMILLANDRELMGRWVNASWLNWVAVAIVAFISVCGAAYAVDSFLQAVHLV
jgi:Mn2+/Fe2+ NRAMP family transporter